MPHLYNESTPAVCSRFATFYNSLTAFTKNLPAARKTCGFATEYASVNDLLPEKRSPARLWPEGRLPVKKTLDKAMGQD